MLMTNDSTYKGRYDLPIRLHKIVSKGPKRDYIYNAMIIHNKKASRIEIVSRDTNRYVSIRNGLNTLKTLNNISYRAPKGRIGALYRGYGGALSTFGDAH